MTAPPRDFDGLHQQWAERIERILNAEVWRLYVTMQAATIQVSVSGDWKHPFRGALFEHYETPEV